MKAQAKIGRWQLLAVVTVIFAALPLGGCQADDGPAPEPTASRSTVSPTPSQSTTTTETAADRDARLASKAVVTYWAVIDDLAAHPERDLGRLTEVATGQALQQRRITLATYRSDGWVQTGAAVLSAVQPRHTTQNHWSVSACVDVRGIDFVDSEGTSQVNPNRPDSQRFSYVVTRGQGEFLVSQDSLKGTSC